MTEIAVEYILDILTKKAMLPTAFIEESFDWIHQWLLEPNPKIAIRLFDSNRSLDNKRGIIETQLDTLEDNVLFQRALASKLLLFVQYKVKNTGNTLGESNNEKNIAKNSAVQAGRDARFGDDVVNGNQTVNHYHGLDKTKLEEQFVSREEMDEHYVKRQDIETAIQPISELIEQNTLQFQDLSPSLDTILQTYSASQKHTEKALKALIKGTHL